MTTFIAFIKKHHPMPASSAWVVCTCQATGQYLVEYDAYATLDLDGMDWHMSLYRLCADPNVRIDEMTIGMQHIKQLPMPEHKVWPVRRAGGGGGGGGGAGGGGGRRRALRDAADDAERAAGGGGLLGADPDLSASDGSGDGEREASAASGADSADAPEDSEGSGSDDSVFAKLFGGGLEVTLVSNWQATTSTSNAQMFTRQNLVISEHYEQGRTL